MAVVCAARLSAIRGDLRGADRRGPALALGFGEAAERGGVQVARFGARGKLPAAGLAACLSGLLIGAELAAALPASDASAPWVLAGEAAPCDRCRLAVGLWGREASVGAGPIAALGLWPVAQQAGWCCGAAAPAPQLNAPEAAAPRRPRRG